MGRQGGKARAKKLSAAELSEQGRAAVLTRWAKHNGSASRDEGRRRIFLALAGSLSEKEARELRQSTQDVRDHWR